MCNSGLALTKIPAKKLSLIVKYIKIPCDRYTTAVHWRYIGSQTKEWIPKGVEGDY